MNEFVQGNINFFLGACVGVAITAIVTYVVLSLEFRRGVEFGRKLTLNSIYGKMGQSLRSDENIVGKMAAVKAYTDARNYGLRDAFASTVNQAHEVPRLYTSHCDRCSWQANRLMLKQADALSDVHRRFHPDHSTTTRIVDDG